MSDPNDGFPDWFNFNDPLDSADFERTESQFTIPDQSDLCDNPFQQYNSDTSDSLSYVEPPVTNPPRIGQVINFTNMTDLKNFVKLNRMDPEHWFICLNIKDMGCIRTQNSSYKMKQHPGWLIYKE